MLKLFRRTWHHKFIPLRIKKIIIVWLWAFIHSCIAVRRCCAISQSINQSFIMRPSSLGGGRILRRTLSVRLSVRPVIVAIGNIFSTTASVTSRHLANYNDTHVLFGTHRGPHIVRPSRPHKLVYV